MEFIGGTKIVAAQYSAILDNSTCELCGFLDKQTFLIDDPNLPSPPDSTHISCRCIIAYIGEDEIPENWSPDGAKVPQDILDRFGKQSLINPDSIAKYAKTPGGIEIYEPVIIDDLTNIEPNKKKKVGGQ